MVDNSEFYAKLFGEETVNEMTTGESTNAARELFPRVNFREVEDAEMVVACLQNASIDMVKRAALAMQTVTMSKMVNQMGLVAEMTDQTGAVTDGHSTVKEMTDAIGQMVGMVEAITAQLAVMYGTPDEENAKYVSDLLEFVTDTRAVLADLVGTNEALQTEGK